MAKCKFCGAEVNIGERCNYCGSMAESWYYSKKEKKPKRDGGSITVKSDYEDMGYGYKIFRGRYYIVQKGDTLWGISKKLYGAGAEYYRLVEKNHIQDPNHIEVGWKLYY